MYAAQNAQGYAAGAIGGAQEMAAGIASGFNEQKLARAPEIQIGLERALKRLEEQAQLIAALSERLQPIMRGEPPSPGDVRGASPQSVAQTAIGTGLQEIDQRVMTTNVRLQAMLARVEL